MVRRLASQVHKTASRLKDVKLIPEPVWFQAVLQHPPHPVPPRATPHRTGFDSNSLSLKRQARPRAESIVYLEDRVRRQFFKDHPFEAYRPRSLVENKFAHIEHRVSGLSWTRLSQRSTNPQPEE